MKTKLILALLFFAGLNSCAQQARPESYKFKRGIEAFGLLRQGCEGESPKRVFLFMDSHAQIFTKRVWTCAGCCRHGSQISPEKRYGICGVCLYNKGNYPLVP